MKATYKKIYHWPSEIGTNRVRSRGRIIIKGKTGQNGELAPEQIFNTKQLDRIHNAIKFTQEMQRQR